MSYICDIYIHRIHFFHSRFANSLPIIRTTPGNALLFCSPYVISAVRKPPARWCELLVAYTTLLFHLKLCAISHVYFAPLMLPSDPQFESVSLFLVIMTMIGSLMYFYLDEKEDGAFGAVT